VKQQTLNILLKAKAHNTYISPQATYHSAATDRASVQPIGRRLSLSPQTLTCDQTAIRSHGLPAMVCCLMISTHVIHNYVDYYSFTDPEGRKAEVAWI